MWKVSLFNGNNNGATYEFHKTFLLEDSTEINEKKSRPNETTGVPQSSKLTSWNEAEVLTETFNTSVNTMKNIVQLLHEDNTIPFICRYRKELTGNISPDVYDKKTIQLFSQFLLCLCFVF